MASLNDIETRIQNIIDIIEHRVISTITGVLPITFRADGSVLINYRIYGTADGAGVQTENLCPMIFSHSGVINDNGQIGILDIRLWSVMIPVESNTDYVLSVTGTASNDENLVFNRIINYDVNQNFINRASLGSLDNQKTITTESNVAYIVLDIRTPSNNVNIQLEDVNKISVTEGSNPPETYIPYGYKIPLTLTSGAESKDTNIYIGDSKLLSNDYVDYESGKIVRNGTPQDPPLPLPAIDTYTDINTLDSVETLGEVTIKGKIKEVI